ncbi:hypothetical protein SRHO_G00218190 [Serrasalmus rhombeus]
MAEKQRDDQMLAPVINQLETGEKPPPTLRKELPDVSLIFREWNKLELRDGVLYRRRQGENQTSYQLVLPSEFRPIVLQSLHDKMGHMGVERTLDLVRSRFYWPKMPTDVEKKIQTCGRCVRRKALPDKAAPLVNIPTTRPLELVSSDVEPTNSTEKPKRPRTRQNPCVDTNDVSDREDETDDQVPTYHFSCIPPSETMRITYEYDTPCTGDAQRKGSSPQSQNAPTLQYLPLERRVTDLPENIHEPTEMEHLPVPECPTKNSGIREEEIPMVCETVQPDGDTEDVKRNSERSENPNTSSAIEESSPVRQKNLEQCNVDVTEPQAETEDHVRRSSRDRVPVRRLHYPG